MRLEAELTELAAAVFTYDPAYVTLPSMVVVTVGVRGLAAR
jgi:hypothetical protein